MEKFMRWDGDDVDVVLMSDVLLFMEEEMIDVITDALFVEGAAKKKV